MKVNVVNSTSA